MNLQPFAHKADCVKCGAKNIHPKFHSNEYGCRLTISGYGPLCPGADGEHLFYPRACGYAWITATCRPAPGEAQGMT